MGRKKGTPTRYWSEKEKEKLILAALEEGITNIGKANDLSIGMLSNWVKSYKNNDNKVLNNRYKRGNPLSKYQNRKGLSDIENLEYENMKLRIELERLKKGYRVEGDGQNKRFISINNKNLK